MNSSPDSPTLDVLALGEAVMDFISSEVVTRLEEAHHFERFTGGQVANLAVNLAYLGTRVALGACVGDDGFGRRLREHVAAAGVEIAYIQISKAAPTTLIPITRTTSGTPEFIVYRGADALLQHNDRLLSAAGSCEILHTSAFALSREPARSTILQMMQVARENGNRVSLDPNYHPRIWPDVENFVEVLPAAFKNVSFTKPSLDDCTRLFGRGLELEEYAERFLHWGVELVVISMGAKGLFLATNTGEQYHIIPHQISAVDVTGAGDAFWSGFLTALLAGSSPLDAARVGQVMAEIKIGTIGPLSHAIDRKAIFAKAQSIQYHTTMQEA